MEISEKEAHTILQLIETVWCERLGNYGDGILARRIVMEFPDIEVPFLVGEEIHKPLCLGSRLQMKEGSIITSILRKYVDGGEYPVPQGQCRHCGQNYDLEEEALTFEVTDRVAEHYPSD